MSRSRSYTRGAWRAADRMTTILPGMGTQLLLFGAGGAEAKAASDPLGEAFRRLAPGAAPAIVYAAARRRIFSWTPAGDGRPLTLRVGPEFRDAPRSVAEALVHIVTRRTAAARRRRGSLFFEVRSFSALAAGCGSFAGRSLPPAGNHVDLSPVLAKVQSERFRTRSPRGSDGLSSRRDGSWGATRRELPRASSSSIVCSTGR